MTKVAVALFVLTYAGFLIWNKKRTLIAAIGASLMLFVGVVTPLNAFVEFVHWNVIALFSGTLILAELFLISKMPAAIAEYVVDKTGRAKGAVIVMCLLSSFISIFVENVAVVLLLSPVLFSLCQKLDLSPSQPIIFLAMFSNVQGTATLIGDPPSMILGGYLHMSFNDFFVFHGKPSIFFVIQAGALSALLYTFWFFRSWTKSIELLQVEKPLSYVPTILLVLFILTLSFSSNFDPEFRWLAGTCALVFAAIGLVWHRLGPHWMSTRKLIAKLDWDTTIFLIALFILVGVLQKTNVIDQLASTLSGYFQGNILFAYIAIIFISLVLSAVVDNVPYILTMIPIVEKLAFDMGAPLTLFVFALLVGSCLGGNITPVGALANIVAVGLLKKRGYDIHFKEYIRMGLPFTASAVIVASVFLWVLWS